MIENIYVEAGNSNYKSIDGNLYTNDGETLISYASGKTDELFKIPEGTVKIAIRALTAAENLKNIEVPDSLTIIEEYAFINTFNLESITFGENSNLTTIENNAFYASGINSIEIPRGVTNLSEKLFYLCGELTDVTIPDSIESIENGVFHSCESLETIKFNGTVAQWNEIELTLNWNANCDLLTTVICSDGTVTL